MTTRILSCSEQDWNSILAGDELPHWVVPKDAVRGDNAFFFFGDRLVARGRISGKPGVSEGANEPFGRRYRATVAGVQVLEHPITLEMMTAAFPDWGWPTYPRSYTTPPLPVAEWLEERAGGGSPGGPTAAGGSGAHWLQYHNPDKRGEIRPGRDTRFAVSSSKNTAAAKGSTIWLITRRPGTKEYYLALWFTCDLTGRRRGAYFAEGPGHSFGYRVRVDVLPWFDAFQKRYANFSLGLCKITDQSFVSGLLAAAAGGNNPPKGQPTSIPPSLERQVSGQAAARGAPSTAPQEPGQGYGDAAANKEVEQRAVELVTRDMQRQGWRVVSKESDHVGYDLLCRKGSTTRCVEVKGVRGSEWAVFLTAGEKRAADGQHGFLLAVVRCALTTAPIIRYLTPDDLQKYFQAEPVQYRLRPTTQSVGGWPSAV